MELLTIAEVRSLRERLEGYVVETPVWQWRNRDAVEAFGAETAVFLKLELFQHTGTFKRGALSVMLDLDRQALARGVTAVSAGNHAIAVAYAAQLLGAEAKVVMPKSASPIGWRASVRMGGEVVLVDDVGQAFAKAEEIQKEEGRTFVHPYEDR